MSLPRYCFALLLAGLFSSLPAHAALFEDDEARKAILDLRGRIQQGDDAQRLRIEQLLAQIQEQATQFAPLRRSLLDLNGQIETLSRDIAKLVGQIEQLARDLSETQR